MNLVQVWSWVCLNFFEKESICKLSDNAFMQFRALNRVRDTFQVMIAGKVEKSHITLIFYCRIHYQLLLTISIKVCLTACLAFHPVISDTILKKVY